MAKKVRRRKRVNKSQAIRDYIQANPKAGPTQVSQALTEKGTKVSVALVSNVKHNMNKKAIGTRRGGAGGHVSVDALRVAKKLADQLGGIEKARHALDVLAELS